MLQEMANRSMILILLVTLLSVPVGSARAQPASIVDAMSTQETVLPGVRPAATWKQTRYSKPCDTKRRALVGGAIGFMLGMVVVKGAARANDGSIGAKGTLQAGAYGGAIGAFVGVRTCP